MTKYLLVEDMKELRNRVANELQRPPKGAEIFVASSGADGYMVKSTFNSPIQIRRYLEIVLEKHRSQASNVSGHLEK